MANIKPLWCSGKWVHPVHLYHNPIESSLQSSPYIRSVKLELHFIANGFRGSGARSSFKLNKSRAQSLTSHERTSYVQIAQEVSTS
ncbi:hypothetical protein Mapa_001032 [Marchantia paleacea]|nr:hypothetical protein Mapa_001032 [Marchantia paleacea]